MLRAIYTYKNKYLGYLLLFPILAALLANPFSAFAHVGPEEKPAGDIEATIVEPDLFTAKNPIAIWLEVKDKVSDQIIENLDVNAKVHDSKGQEIFAGVAKPKGSEGGQTPYVFEATFPSGGEYKISYEFTHDGKENNFSFPVTVSEPVEEDAFAWTLPMIVGAVAAGIILLAALIWGITKRQYKKLAIFLIVVAIAGVVAYSLFVTFRSGALKSGVVTCLEDGRCFWTAHVHSYLVIKACGEEKHLPVEVGSLSKTHTHEEQNILHWHDRLPYDNEKKEILDTKPLTLGSSFDEVKVPFDKGKVFGLKDGDMCPDGKAGSWKMFVNGKKNDEFRDYVWQDKDIIVLFFDDRSQNEIERELQENPISFPALGRE